MTAFDFELKFALPPGTDPAGLTDRLFEAGCDDALIGVGRMGTIGLDFTREAANAAVAVHGAIDDVLRAVPDAELVEVRPDLVGFSDFARLIGCSRQNVRKHAVAPGREQFPLPAVTGEISLWHAIELCRWFEKYTTLTVPPAVLEVAGTACKINLGVQHERLKRAHPALAYG